MHPTLLLVHGAWHNGAGFKKLQEELSQLGISSKTVELSSAAAADQPIGDMYQDAKIVREAVDSIDGDVVVLGHSYGGLPITEGLVGHPRVKSLIYLTAFMLDKGETLYAACGSQDPSWWQRNNDDTRLTPKTPHDVFYNQCDREISDAAIAALRTQSLSSFNQAITRVSWKEIPSTYIICEEDQAIPLFAQEAMSQRAGAVLRMNSDHSPFLSHPRELAGLIASTL